MLAAAPFIIILAAWAADKLWPLPLQEVNPARVVVAQDGTPLWRFADADSIWRYPVTIEDVSPRCKKKEKWRSCQRYPAAAFG